MLAGVVEERAYVGSGGRGREGLGLREASQLGGHGRSGRGESWYAGCGHICRRGTERLLSVDMVLFLRLG